MRLSTAFGYWLAGFIDGEGCFIIRETPFRGGRSGVYCGFSMELRDDDAEIIHEICRSTGIGTIKRRERAGKNGNDCPQISWNVQSGGDCAELVEILDEYPLRAKKKRDYEIWRLAVREQLTHKGRPGKRRQKIDGHIDRMLAYRELLHKTKQYGGDSS